MAAADLLAPLNLPEGLALDHLSQALRPRHSDAAAYVADRLAVFVGERACAAGPGEVHGLWEAQPRSLEFVYRYTCPADEGPHRLQYQLFFDLDPLHSGFLQLLQQGVGVGGDVFRDNHREHFVMMVASPWRQVRRFWLLGVEHIFTGYDHLAFLAGLLLLAALIRGPQGWQAAPLRQAVLATAQLVTAFTVAHSITLAFAALRPHAFSTAWVEPAIALSVALVGAENLLPRAPRRRWVMALLFGLVHGFGFASVLQEIGLPRQGLLRSLLAFNVGVESGQLLVVGIAMPALVWIARTHPRLYTWVFLRAAAVFLILAGLVWMIERIAG